MKKLLLISVLCLMSCVVYATAWYSKTGGGVATTLATWTSNPTGGAGSAPGAFTTAGDTFIVNNGVTLTGTAWTLGTAGTYTTVLQLGTGTITQSSGTTVTIYGDLTLNSSGGIAVTTGALVINLWRNLFMASTSALGSSGTTTINLCNTSSSFGSPQLISNSSSGSKSNVTYNIPSGCFTQLNAGFVLGASTVTLSVANGGSLICGTNTVTGTGVFTLNSGANLYTANTAGITAAVATATGSIQCTTTRTFNSAGNYYYNGSSAQVTGTGFPSGPSSGGTLNINNSAGVTLSQATTFASGTTIAFTSGKLGLGAFTHTLNGTITGMSATNSFTTISTSGISTTTTGSLGTLYFDGASNTLGTFTLNQSGGSITLGNALSIATTLNLYNGTFNNGSNLTMATGSTINRDNGTLSSVPTWGGTTNVAYTTGGPSTATVTAGNELPTTATNLGTLTVNKASCVLTLPTSITVNSTLALTQGKLVIGSNTLTLKAGTSGMSAANYLTGGSSSNVTISGTTAVTLYFDQTTSTTTNNLNTLTINTTSTVTLNNAIFVSSTLNLYNGTFSILATSNLTMLNATTINRDNGTVTPVPTWGSGGTGVINVNYTTGGPGTTTVTTGNELPTTNTNLGSVTINKSGATITQGAGKVINGSLTITAGTLSAATFVDTIKGNFVNNGTFTYTASSSTIVFGGSSAQTISGSSTTPFNIMVLNNAAGLTISSTTISFASGALLKLANGTLTNTASNLTMASGSGLHRDNGLLAATPSPYSGVTVTYISLGQNTSVTTDIEWPATFSGSVVVNKTGQTITLQNAKTLSVLSTFGSITITAGTLDVSTSNYAINFSGTWSKAAAGVFTARSGTVTCNGTASQVITGSTNSFYILTINNSAGVTLSNFVTFASGTTLNLQTGTLTTGGLLQFSSGSNLVIDNGTLSATPSPYSGVTLTYANLGVNSSITTGLEWPASFSGNVNINKTGQTITLNAAKTLTLAGFGNLTLTAGTLDVSASVFAITLSTGSWTNNGGTFTARTGTVTFNYASGQTVGGTSTTSFNNLTISDASNVTQSGNNIVNGILTISSGKFALGAYTLTLNGTVAAMTTTLCLQGSASSGLLIGCSGALGTLLFDQTTAGTTNNLASFTMNGTGNATLGNILNISSSMNLYNGTFRDSTFLTMLNGSTINRDNGTIVNVPTWGTGGTGVINVGYTLGGPGTAAVTTGIEVPTSASNLGKLFVNKTGCTISLGISPTANDSIKILAGTLSAGGYDIVAKGNWLNNAIFSAGATSVLFSGSSAQVISGSTATNFNNVTINNSAGVTIGSNCSVNGTLLISSGTLSNGSATLTSNGPWTNNATFNGATGTVVFGGSSAQTIGGSSSTTFNNLTIGNSSGVILGINTTVGNTLNFTSGTIDAATYTLTANGNVTGAGSSTYVKHNFKKPVTGVNPIVFETGDANYAPVTLTYNTVPSAGSVTVSAIAGWHPQFLTSGFSASNIVNHYWSIASSSLTGVTTVTPKFTYNASDIGGGSNAAFLGQQYSGSSWGGSFSATNTSSPYSSSPASAMSTSAYDGDYIFGLAVPLLHAAVGATVDNPFTITFTEDATWRGAITQIAVGSNILPPSSYDFSTAGQITFDPSLTSYLQVARLDTIFVTSTGYGSDAVGQLLLPGVATKLGMGINPGDPLYNTGPLSPQPTVLVQDQYGNTTPSTASISAAVGAGTWTLGGTVTISAAAGIAPYTDLTASAAAPVTGATIVFTSSPLTPVTSGTFNLPRVPMSGTINVPGDYADLGQAIHALNTSGVSGPVLINCTADQSSPVAGDVAEGSLSTAIGAGYVINVVGTYAPTATNTVTIEGHNHTITSAALSPASNYNDAIFTIAGTSYVKINNFILKENAANTTATSSNNMTEFGVALVRGTSTTEGSQNCTISNMNIQLNSSYTNYIGIYSNADNSYASSYATYIAAGSSGGANSGNSFYSDTITGATSGFVIAGDSVYNDVNLNIGGAGQSNIVTLGSRTANMTMTTALANYVKTRQDGIYTSANNTFSIKYNTITLPTGGSTNNPDNGIFTNTSSSSGSYINAITNNTITMTTTSSGVSLLGIQNYSGNSSSTIKLNNNLVNLTNTTGLNIGVNNNRAVSILNMNTNNIVQNSNSGHTISLFNSASATTMTITNDTTNVTGTGDTTFSIYNTGAITTGDISNCKVTIGVTTACASGINNAGSLSTGTINNNSITLTQGASIALTSGITNSAGSAVSLSINSNSVNMTTASTGSFFGIFNAASDSLIRVNRNNVFISSSGAVVSPNLIYGLYVTALNEPPTVYVCSNTVDISTSAATSASVFFVAVAPTNPNPVGILTEVDSNVVKSTSNLSITTGNTYLFFDQFANMTNKVKYNSTSGSITRAAGSGIFGGIRASGATALSSYSLDSIAFNRISNITLGGTATFWGIYNANSTAQGRMVCYDTVNNIVGGSGNTIGLYEDFCPATAVVQYNIIGSLNGGASGGLSGAGDVVGISNQSTVGSINAGCFGGTYQGNRVTGLSSSGASNNVLGILNWSSATPGNNYSMINDTVAYLSTSGNTTPFICGMYENLGSAVTNTGNLIHDFSATTTTGSLTINALRSAGTTTSVSNIYKNTIYNISGGTSAGTTTSIIGLQLNSATFTYNVYNNFITNMTAPSANNPDALVGISMPNAGATWNLYNNTIYLPSLTGGTNFGAAGVMFPSSTSKLTLKNNIINLATSSTLSGTGIAACLRRNIAGTTGTPPTTSNYDGNYNTYYINTNTRNYFYAEQTAGGTVTNPYNITIDANFNTCGGTYKSFMGSGRESATYTENNLSAGSATGTCAPSGSSFAYQSGLTITSPSITDDWSGTTRPTTPSRGALEFSGSAPTTGAPPVVNFTPLTSISYCIAVPPTLSATITSGAGINTTTGTKPRLYYKGNTDADNYGGANNSSFDGWKYVEASNTSSPFSFTPDYSLLNHTATSGTVISYFVIAQDLNTTPLVGYYQVGFASGYCPSSVAVTASAVPTAASPTVNSFTITALPSFTTTVSQSFFCGTNNNAVLTVSPSPADLTIQWQQDYGSGTFADISGGTSNGYSSIPPSPPSISSPSATNNYRANVSCNASIVATSSTAAVADYSPTITSSTPGDRCGTGAVTLGGAGSTGSVLNWYSAASGGLPLGTGTTFNTPSITGTTIFYVADSFGTFGGTQHVGLSTISGSIGFYNIAPGGFGLGGQNFTVYKPLTISSVDIFPSTTTGTVTIGIYSTAGTLLYSSAPATVTNTYPTAQTIPLNFYLDSGSYQIALTPATSSTQFFQYGSLSGFTFPYTSVPNVLTITSSTYGPAYFFFHNWQVSAGCIGARTAVTATVNALPTAGTITGTPTSLCVGASENFSETGSISGGGTLTSYSWTGPDGYSSTGAGPTLNPPPTFSPSTTAASGYYSLTVTYPGTGCTSVPVASPFITVNDTATPVIGGTLNACVGASSTLTTSIPSGTWSSSSSAVATIDPTLGIVTGVTPGTATISYTSPCGLVGTATFTVNTTPAAITGLASLCVSSTTTLGNTVGGGTWTSSNIFVATIGSSSGFLTSGASSGTTTISYSIGSCTSTLAFSVSNLSPSAISGASSVCAGLTTALTDPTLGGSWSSSDASLATVDATTGVVTGVASGSLTITYSTGCGTDATQGMTVNGTSISISNNGPLCSGSTLNLSATVAAGTYAWSGPNGFTSTLQNPSLSNVAASGSGTYSFSATVSGCTSSARTFVVVDSTPAVTVTATPNAICAGGTSALSDVVNGPTGLTVYAIPYSLTVLTSATTLNSASSWTGGNDDGYINVSIPFSFSLYGTSYSSVNISPNGYVNFAAPFSSGGYTPMSLPTTSSSAPKSMIALFWHDMAVTSGTITYGTMGVAPNRKFIINYNAVPDASSSQTNTGQIVLYETSNIVDVLVSNTSSSTKTCGVQNSSGTSAQTASGENAATYAITSDAPQGWRFVTPVYHYTWSPGTGLSGTTISNPTSSGLSASQTYTVTTTDQYSSCTTGAVTSLPLTVNPVPVIGAISPSSANLCVGGSAVLTATSISGGAGAFVSYVWTGSDGYANTITSVTTTTVTVSPTTSATYSVVANYAASGCTGVTPATTSFTVAAQPGITSVTPSPATVCTGGTLSFTSVTTGGAGAATYSWSGPDITTTSSGTSTSPTFTPSLTGTNAYSLTLSYNGIGCNSASAVRSVTVTPTPTITLGGMPSICQGTTAATISYSATTGSPTTYSINWSGPAITAGFSNVSASGLSGGIISITVPSGASASTYSGSLTVSNGTCTSTTYSISITVAAYPSASVGTPTAPCVGYATNVVFSGTSGADVDYNIDGGSTSTATLAGGTYSLSTGAISGTHNYTLINVHNAVCTTAVGTTVYVTPTPMQWAGTVSIDWNNAANWTCSFVPGASDDVTIPAGTPFAPDIAASGSGTTGNLTIASGAAVTVNSSANLHVKGNMTNNGTVSGAGTLSMDNTSAQTVSGFGYVNNFDVNNAAGITVNSASRLTVKKVLSITSGTLATGDSVVLYSDSTGTARVAPLPSGTPISGNVKVNQYITGTRRAYRFWAHPFNNFIPLSQLTNYIDISGPGGAANGFTTTASNAPSSYWYNTYAGNSSLPYDIGWRQFASAYATPDSNKFKRYQGIRVYYRGSKGQGLSFAAYTPSPTTVSQWGVLNQGTQDITMSRGSSILQDYNMVGNPYPSPVDIGTVIFNAAAAGRINGAYFYIWNPFLGVAGGFVPQSYSTGGGSPAAIPYYLQGNDAFQVRALHDGDQLNFAESNKSATISSAYSLMKARQEFVSLYVYDLNYHPYDMLFVKFDDAATSEEDVKYDGGKPSGADFNFYSWSADHHKLVVDARPYKAESTIPLGISGNYAQDFIIKVENLAVPKDGRVYLHDKLLKQFVLLQQGTEYRFSVTSDPSTQGDERFELSIEPSEVAPVKTNKSLQVSMTPNPATDEVKITFSSAKAEKVGIRITDLSGISVFNKELGVKQTGSVAVPLSNLASGVYMVELNSGNEKVIEKLIKE